MEGEQSFLVLIGRGGSDRSYDLEQDLMRIGRGPSCEIRVPESHVSHVHAEVFRRDGRWWIRDLGSRNGTHVNDEVVQGDRALKANDRIELGGVSTLFFAVRRPAAVTPPPVAEAPRERIEPPTLPDPRQISATPFIGIDLPPEVRRDLEPAESLMLTRLDVERIIRDRRIARIEGKVDEPTLAILYQLASSLGTAGSEPELLEAILDLTLALLPGERAFIFLGEPILGPDGSLIACASRTRKGEPARAFGSKTIIDHVMREGAAIATSNAATDKRFGQADSIRRHRVRAVMAAPLITRRQAMGVIYVDVPAAGYRFSYGELMLLSTIAFQAAYALENARLLWALQQRCVDLSMELERQRVHRVGSESTPSSAA